MSSNNKFSNIGIKKIESAKDNDSTSNQNKDLMSMEDQEKKRYAQDTDHRKLLVIWMICTVSIWLGIVLFIIVFNNLLKFYIQTQILIVLLATTTLNVLGLANIILKGLFPQPQKNIFPKRRRYKSKMQ